MSESASVGTETGGDEKPATMWQKLLNRYRRLLAGALAILGLAAVVAAIDSTGALAKTLLFCAAGVSLFASSVALLKPRKRTT